MKEYKEIAQKKDFHEINFLLLHLQILETKYFQQAIMRSSLLLILLLQIKL